MGECWHYLTWRRTIFAWIKRSFFAPSSSPLSPIWNTRFHIWHKRNTVFILLLSEISIEKSNCIYIFTHLFHFLITCCIIPWYAKTKEDGRALNVQYIIKGCEQPIRPLITQVINHSLFIYLFIYLFTHSFIHVFIPGCTM